MAPLDEYRTVIQDLMRKYGRYKPSYGDVERQLVFDPERDHYFLYTVGWDGERRIHGCTMHIDIINDKIWIQHNATEVEIAEELVEQGIPKEKIVLGMHPPSRRKYTEYAMA